MKWFFVPGVRGLILGASCLCALFLASGGIQVISAVEKEESSTTHYEESDDDVSPPSAVSSPDSSQRFRGDIAKGTSTDDLARLPHPSHSLSEEEDEDDERVESEDYETAAARRGQKQRRPSTSGSSMLIAKQQLTADEYAKAEAEIQAEIEALERFHGTTTTTPRPGFFKEVLGFVLL
ncbi:hypothetical protein ACSSS7_003324 [Eimeria intestinalis]